MDLSAANYALWNPIIQLGIVAALVLLANVMRRKIPFFRANLMPTAVIAGFILLGIRVTNLLPIDAEFLEMLTYHMLALGFIATSLRVPDEKNKSTAALGSRTGALIVSTYLVQAIAGLVISLALAYTFMPELFKAAGILLPMGYGQGPGQANNVGSMYENFGMEGGRSFGLAISAAGYLVAYIFGVIYLNVLNRKGKIKRAEDKGQISGSVVTVSEFQHDNEIPIAESVDKLSVQFALVSIVYLVTYLVIWGVTSLIAAVAPGLADTVSTLLWGFNFIVGSMMAMLCRTLFVGLRKTKLMNRQYQNNYLLSRISGLAFDIMIVAGIAGINFEDLTGYWVPFLLMVVAGGVATFFFLKFMCQKLYPDFVYEGFFGMFGMLTGTISSGVLLLREIDPDFKTPASNQLITGSSFAIAFGAPLLVLISFAGKGESAVWIAFGLVFVYLAALLGFIALVGRKKKK